MICPDSGAEFMAIHGDSNLREDIRCSCGQTFNVRIIRSRRGVALDPPIKRVPRHDPPKES